MVNFIAFGRVGSLQVRDFKRGCVYGEDYGIELCVGERAWKCDRENRDWRWRQIKSIDKW